MCIVTDERYLDRSGPSFVSTFAISVVLYGWVWHKLVKLAKLALDLVV